eukprot:CAMPEP_0117652776 /NCGR_PEP_ID=MMETSP0804-20121206/2818_1 /TAXON_ID=1074897 /ORGANISM="Tetraselmis astigmatica, Strain CCMP880" /LENGTH=613 /DNA_ID=CAMNT_0005458867 /DNA_START=159 /DNA_END=2000 /DNA_ORIENTATION=+
MRSSGAAGDGSVTSQDLAAVGSRTEGSHTELSITDPSPRTGIMGVLSKVHEVVWILLGAVVGVIIGVVLSLSGASPEFGIWLGMFGTLYIRALTLLVAPLVFCSVSTGVASLADLGLSTGTVGWRTVGFYFLTTIIAVAEGLAVTYALMPVWNKDGAPPSSVVVEPSVATFDSFAMIDMMRIDDSAMAYGDNATTYSKYLNNVTANRVVFRLPGAPENTTVTDLLYLYEATVSFNLPAAVGSNGPYLGEVGEMEVYNADDVLVFAAPAGSLVITSPESSGDGISASFQNLFYSIVPSNLVGIFYGCVEGGCSPDLLSLITFAIAFSLGMLAIKSKMSSPDVVLPLLTELMDIIMWLVMLVIKGTPVAVACLILSAIAANPLDELMASMSSLGVLVAGLILAFVFHLLVTMSLLSWGFTRTNPYKHIAGMGRAMTLSFGCASSMATLPTNIMCCEEMGFEPSVVRFVLSLGATVSMDGTAIYIPGVIVWLAAQAGIMMTFGEVMVLAIIATLASAGASPTPGLIAIVILAWGSVFPGVPVPPEIAYLAAIDWLIDRCVTTTNITGDSFVTRIMDHIIKKDASKDPEAHEAEKLGQYIEHLETKSRTGSASAGTQ